jgi:hypothetical protein
MVHRFVDPFVSGFVSSWREEEEEERLALACDGDGGLR